MSQGEGEGEGEQEREGAGEAGTPEWDKHSSSSLSEVSVACLQDRILQMEEHHYRCVYSPHLPHDRRQFYYT